MINDWLWLLKNDERRISNWAYKFLSIRGRLTLIRAILQGIPVYWFSLARIPKSILRRMRQCIFTFLWGGRKQTQDALNKLEISLKTIFP